MQAIIKRLQDLIGIPSYSRKEDKTAEYISNELFSAGIPVQRNYNNVIAKNKGWRDGAPILLLNSHHDTVQPTATYTRDPFKPSIESDRLYGLGSNDAGGALSCLIQVFLDYYNSSDLPFNLLLIASAEEEISGPNGIQSALGDLPKPWGALVGEPTQMRAAVAERGLMVVDGHAIGESGHAARQEGKNALYIASDDIGRIRQHKFNRKSIFLPDTQAVVTQINAGSQHNVIPDGCDFVIDVRVNDRYTNKEIFDILDQLTTSKLTARSYRLNSSFLPEKHPLFCAVKVLGFETYGSPTLSDQALMDFPSLKIGPGKSARSHTADEFIKIDELESGYSGYRNLIETLKKQMR